MNEPLTDLLSRSALGDRGAFARLYELASPKLYGIAMRLLKQRSQADDALQEAFSKIWYRAGSYRPDLGNPMTWMTAILRNQALDMLTAQGRHERRGAAALPAAAARRCGFASACPGVGAALAAFGRRSAGAATAA